MPSIPLEWKEYTVNLDKVQIYFKTNLSSNYDGLNCTPDLNVMFKEEIQSNDYDAVIFYWDSLTSTSFNLTLNEIVFSKIVDARDFGNKIMVDAAVENVLLGITQAGKTGIVSDYLHKFTHYLSTGSLYQCLVEIERLKADAGRPDISPFVTNDRLDVYGTKIRTYLGI